MITANKPQKGFTIVELLIVIVVIGILAAISIVAYSQVQERARVARAKSDVMLIEKAILGARASRSMELFRVTGSTYTDGGDQTRYEQTLDALTNASGINLSPLKAGDPWGRKYFIDENENENPAVPCNRRDQIGITPARLGFGIRNVPYYVCPEV